MTRVTSRHTRDSWHLCVTVLQKYLANEILIAAGSTQKKSCPENQIRTRDLANTEVTVTLLFHNIN